MRRIAMLSVHACPLARLGSKETGGMNVYVRELSLELARAGLEIDVFTRRLDPTDAREVPMGPGVRLVHLDAGEVGPIDKNAVIDHLPEFVAGLERYRAKRGVTYDLVHSHYWLSAHVGAELAALWGVPHVTMFHTLGEVKNRCGAPGQESAQRIAVERKVVASVDRITAASENELGHLVDLYGADPAQVSIVPCGVNTSRFRPLARQQARAELGLDGRWVALFVGRMDPLKGLDLLLQAGHQLSVQAPNLQIVVVGGDAVPESEEARVRDLARDLGLAERVRFVGAVPQADLPRYYSAADVCVVPSYYESFGLVAVEALACGTPVIASRVGGLPKVVKHGENGLLVPERTAAAFAASIAALHEDEALRADLARRARGSIGHLVWGAIARRIASVYEELLAGRSHPDPVRRALCSATTV
ncbi:MAG: glycosyltransferase [Chloroflexota bacterium]